MCSPRPTCYPELYHPFKFQHFLSLQLTLLYLAKQEWSTDLWVYTPDFWMTLCVFEVHILKSCSIICPRRIFLVTVFYVVWGKAEGCITFIYQEWEWRGNLSMAFVFKYLTSFFFLFKWQFWEFLTNDIMQWCQVNVVKDYHCFITSPSLGLDETGSAANSPGTLNSLIYLESKQQWHHEDMGLHSKQWPHCKASPAHCHLNFQGHFTKALLILL